MSAKIVSSDVPETPEGAAWALFLEIRREEEKAGANTGNNQPVRTRLLALYAECLAVARGRETDWRHLIN